MLKASYTSNNLPLNTQSTVEVFQRCHWKDKQLVIFYPLRGKARM